MSITKLKSVGPWPVANTTIHPNDGATLGGRRVIVGMLTGSAPAPEHHPSPKDPKR